MLVFEEEEQDEDDEEEMKVKEIGRGIGRNAKESYKTLHGGRKREKRGWKQHV